MDRRRTILGVVLACATLLLVGTTLAVVASGTLTPKEQLGQAIFFDENLSTNDNQSCATCHGPAGGLDGSGLGHQRARRGLRGLDPGAFGDRKPPSSAYATSEPDPARGQEGPCSSAATSGTAAPPARGWAARPPSRRRDPS